MGPSKLQDLVLDILRELPGLVNEELHDKILSLFKKKKALVKNLNIFHTTKPYQVVSPQRFYQLLLNIWDGRDVDKFLQYLRLAHVIAYDTVLRYTRGEFRHARIAIMGKSGVGKTTYALYGLYGAMRLVGLPEDAAWILAAGLTFHDLLSFANFIELVMQEGLFVPAVIIDEASLVASKYWIFASRDTRQRMAAILEIFDLLKDHVAVVIFTTPDIQNMAKRLRDIIDFKIVGTEAVVGNYSFSIFFIIRKMPIMYNVRVVKYVTSKAKVEELCVDVDLLPRDLKLPEWVWQLHLTRRQTLVQQRIEQFREKLLEAQQEMQIREPTAGDGKGRETEESVEEDEGEEEGPELDS